MHRLLPLLCLVAALAGCGGVRRRRRGDALGDARSRRRGAGHDGGADRLDGDAGIAASRMSKTSYGGRFVQSIEASPATRAERATGSTSSTASRPIAALPSTACATGDVVWWDYRSWAGEDMREPVVVGAFPEPFLHGYDGQAETGGRSLPGRGNAWNALGLAHLIGAASVELAGRARGAGREPARSDGRRRNAHCRAPRAGRHRPARPSSSRSTSRRQAPAQGSRAGQPPLRGAARVRPGAALALLVALAAAALVADHWQVPVAIAAVLLSRLPPGACRRRAAVPARLRRSPRAPCFLITPFVVVNGVDVLWTGPMVPVLGQLDVTTEELAGAAIQALRLAAVTLAFAVYALLLDHDGCCARHGSRGARRSSSRSRRGSCRRSSATPRARRGAARARGGGDGVRGRARLAFADRRRARSSGR